MTVKLVEHLSDLETAMKIRRARYELEGTFDHQWEFLMKFIPAVLKAHPDVKEIAKSIDDTFVRLAEQVVQPTKAPTTAPAPAVTTQEVPPKAKCACGYHFLVADSQADCRDHLDRCDKFAELTTEGKTRLCGQLGLTAYKQSKQSKAKAESIACRHCGRDFTKAQSQWLYDVHLKVSKIVTVKYVLCASLTCTRFRNVKRAPPASMIFPARAHRDQRLPSPHLPDASS